MEKKGKEKIPGEAVCSGIHPSICAVSKSSRTGHILQVPTTGHGGLEDDWAAILPSKTSSLEETGATSDFLYRQSVGSRHRENWLRIVRPYFCLNDVFIRGGLGKPLFGLATE